jgi:hypothetical protein
MPVLLNRDLYSTLEDIWQLGLLQQDFQTLLCFIKQLPLVIDPTLKYFAKKVANLLRYLPFHIAKDTA